MVFVEDGQMQLEVVLIKWPWAETWPFGPILGPSWADMKVP